MDIEGIYKIRRTNFAALLASGSYGTSQKDLSQRIGRSPAQVNQWLSGHRGISDESCYLIADSLGIPRDWLDQPHGRGTQIPADSAHTEASISLTDALCVIGDALDRVDDATRMKAADALLTFAKAPDSRRMREMLATLLDQGESSRVV